MVGRLVGATLFPEATEAPAPDSGGAPEPQPDTVRVSPTAAATAAYRLAAGCTEPSEKGDIRVLCFPYVDVATETGPVTRPTLKTLHLDVYVMQANKSATALM
ncbi:hypothetical protein GCM10009654_42740 [Streptomyces hebeiensis]|uniref:Uncharacterized protein n=1 Tax=Streptomyces hebeiensis TaxID=229486 RepID=A0ABN1UY75_9ACTN